MNLKLIKSSFLNLMFIFLGLSLKVQLSTLQGMDAQSLLNQSFSDFIGQNPYLRPNSIDIRDFLQKNCSVENYQYFGSFSIQYYEHALGNLNQNIQVQRELAQEYHDSLIECEKSFEKKLIEAESIRKQLDKDVRSKEDKIDELHSENEKLKDNIKNCQCEKIKQQARSWHEKYSDFNFKQNRFFKSIENILNKTLIKLKINHQKSIFRPYHELDNERILKDIEEKSLLILDGCN